NIVSKKSPSRLFYHKSKKHTTHTTKIKRKFDSFLLDISTFRDHFRAHKCQTPVIGGSLIEKLHMEKHIESFVLTAGSVDIDSPNLTIRERLTYAKEQMFDTFKKVFPYILVGVGIGALIHNWIPESWIEAVLGSNNPFGVILATIVGIPMYADIFGTIPVA